MFKVYKFKEVHLIKNLKWWKQQNPNKKRRWWKQQNPNPKRRLRAKKCPMA
jgi:hypothetical protein